MSGISRFFQRRHPLTPRREPEDSDSGPSTDHVRRRTEEKLPLASKLLEHPESIDPQLLSPLFSKLPRELRELIWQLSLTRYEDLDHLYDIRLRYARPGQAAPLRIAVQLLQTCRAIYVEAFLTPFRLNPIVVFEGDHADIPPADPLTRTQSRLLLCRKLKFWQFANISSVEITVQQINLEGGSLERVSRLVGALGRHRGHENRGYTAGGYASFVPPAEPDNGAIGPPGSRGTLNDQPSPRENFLIGRKITSLTIRMSRTDWWSWESSPAQGETNPSERLRLEPMINVTSLPSRQANSMAMTTGYEARKAGEEPDFQLDEFEKQGRWGMQIQEYWPDLTTLTLVLETFACKQNQLDYVIQCAKLWRFPLEDGFCLVWDGKEESFRWRGARTYGYESWANWYSDNRAEGFQDHDVATIQWRPSEITNDDAADAQMFIIRTITFERRKDEERTNSNPAV